MRQRPLLHQADKVLRRTRLTLQRSTRIVTRSERDRRLRSLLDDLHPIVEKLRRLERRIPVSQDQSSIAGALEEIRRLRADIRALLREKRSGAGAR